MFRKNLEGRTRSCELSEALVARSTVHRVSLVSFFVATLLAFVLLMVPSQFAHADETTTIDGVKYTYTADQIAIITGMTSNKTAVKVPAQINGKPVVRIDVSETNLGSIKTLDATACTSLEYLICNNAKLTSLRLQGLQSFKHLACNENNIASLDLSNMPSLQYLWCSNNSLSSLNLSGSTALESFHCEHNKLTSLNLSGFSSLTQLFCFDNALSSLNISGCGVLKWVECEDNNLTSLSLAGLTSLEVLICQNNSIKDTSALETWAKDRPQSKVLPQNPAPAPADPGAPSGKWVHSSKGWWYSYSDGSYAKGFKTIKRATYYFDNNGWMKTGWQKISNNWYYFKGSGARTTGWQKVKGTWYYLNPADGKMKTGKQAISGKTYFLKSSGAMKTGWNQEGSKWYYYDKSGAMKTNAWISGKYWVGSDGVMATYSWVDNGRYYVDRNGKWVKNTQYKTGTVSHCIVGRNHSMYKTGFDGTNTHLKCSICGWEQEFKGDLHQTK